MKKKMELLYNIKIRMLWGFCWFEVQLCAREIHGNEMIKIGCVNNVL